MVETGCDSRHTAVEPDDVDRRQALDRGVVSKLCIGVPPPALDTSAAEKCTGVGSTGRNRRDPGRQTDDIDGHQALSRGIVAQLTMGVAAPALHPTVARQRTGVCIARDDRNAGADATRRRRPAVDLVSGAELSEGIAPPASDGTASPYGTAVIGTGGDR
jgi:hypothetical protein